MKRTKYKELLTWKSSKNRKPLLLQGARQVGKTYLIRQFGQQEYANYIYLNFEQDPELKSLFDKKLDPGSIIHNISLYLNRKIVAEDTLIFFDEIQTTPAGITSLKYFYEHAPEYHIIAAGSLLGVSVGKQTSFPVGKVNFMHLYPMSFEEYLLAIDEQILLEELLSIRRIKPLPQLIHDKLLSILKTYLFLGGMPEVVQSYVTNRDVLLVRKIQNEILEAYSRDFSKYTEKSQAMKTSEIWASIPSQLAKENKKFKYSDVKKGSRAAHYQQTIEWLRNAGLIHVVYNITAPKLPLSGYSDRSKFKVYFLDTGLLGAKLHLSPKIILQPTALFSEYNGAFIENFVASELVASGIKNLYYWTSNSDAEVDFVLQINNEVYPIEVKSGGSKNKKSLRSYQNKYQPKYIIRTSPRNFMQDEEFINLPLYAIVDLQKIEMNGGRLVKR